MQFKTKRNNLCTNYKKKRRQKQKEEINDEEANYVSDDRQSSFVLN